MKIPYTELSSETLRNIIDEFVTREGTDYGQEHSLEEKASQVLELLRQNKVLITFDPVSETCSIVSASRDFSRNGPPD
jgi:hypothetical protein